MNLYHMKNSLIKNNVKGQSVARSLLIQIKGKNSCDIALQKPHHNSVLQVQALCLHRNLLQ